MTTISPASVSDLLALAHAMIVKRDVASDGVATERAAASIAELRDRAIARRLGREG